MTTPRRSKYIDKAVVAALRDIRILEAAIVSYEFSLRVMKNHAFGYGASPDWRPDESLRRQLWQKKSDAQARVMLFGNLTTNDELRKAALTVATEFILRENAQIISYLTIEGVPPSRYLSNVDSDFRAEIRAAVKEQLGIDPDLDDEKTYGTLDEDDELENPSEEPR